MSSPCREPRCSCSPGRGRAAGASPVRAASASSATSRTCPPPPLPDTPSAGRCCSPASPARASAAARGPYDGNAYAVSEGKRLYNQFNCSGCHFQGGGGIGPPLMDADWIYGSAPAEHLRDHRRGPAERHAVVRRQDPRRPDLAARGLRPLDERPAGQGRGRAAATTTCRSGARSSRRQGRRRHRACRPGRRRRRSSHERACSTRRWSPPGRKRP